ncbi:adenosylcobinamide-GDP ribazoletransferase [Bacillus sp. B15-48]|uniref:adenosylcobinamide-GDP ribazoletransferase n=1 Tax=Bacillus sp. B15-48 TaxID=1548601 RepID=UPI00193F2410|nr:adenosylcobinamide-GDP ribazoletransferase [Bacillus sp. B15-48]MBM4763262.1 adenosylcobinamide-GDP ribazoletransferase [Bacillus sp. B15-48]
MSWIKGLLINFQFFTSIPIPISLPMDKAHLEKAIQTFPLLGLVQGGIYAFIVFALSEWTPFSSLAIAFIVWLACIIITGGIHLDGWMDASDAFFSYQEKEKRLEIMSDPRTGAFGVLSVIILLAGKFFFIYEIIIMQTPQSYFLIALIPFFGKMVMGVLLLKGKTAKKSGLGTLFKGAANKWTLTVYPLFLLLLLIFTGIVFSNAFLGMLVFIVVSSLILTLLIKKTISWFGGTTGDVLGASVEGTELLLWMTLWLLHYFAMG